ncbi:MAG: hypothetical protein KAT00_14205, partial [Planctomycetes bacterium]|nr:hypothetical protein [Planctomycetota bacterium]
TVQKIAMPPPRGVADLWKRSSDGCAMKADFTALARTMAVRIAEIINAPASRHIANIVNI